MADAIRQGLWSVADPPSFLAEGESKMHYVYVLKSEKNNKRYVGYTRKKPEERLTEHNDGSNSFTSQNGPFKLIYSEQHENKDFAIKRERFFKSSHGRNYLKRVIPL